MANSDKLLLVSNKDNENITVYTDEEFTPQEIMFITEYVSNGCNGALAARSANYATGHNGQECRRIATSLLQQGRIKNEILAQLNAQQSRRIATATEVKQFYTSVMRGEILDQFGIEASLDTRLKAANELAKYCIELPMKLEYKQQQSEQNSGNITLNFIPRSN